MIRDKAFYRSMLAIAVPIALQNIIGFGVQMLDTIMVGSLGDTALSAASLANQPFFVFMIFSFGLASGGSVLIAQYWGRGNTDVVRRVMGISMRCVAVASVLFAAVCFSFPLQVMDIFSNEPDVIEAGAAYLRVVVLSYVFYGVSNCYLTALRGVENVKLATGVYCVSFFVNGFFNYAFIFGKFGFPALGLVGAAWGTVIARMSEFLIVALYSTFAEKKIGFRLRMIFQRERELWADFIRHSLPVVGSELIWSLGSVTQAAIIGNIGSVFVSANSIASVAQQLAMVMMFGVGNAAAVLMGKAIGAGRTEEAKKMGRTFLVIAMGVGVLSCGIILALRTPMLAFYNVSAGTKTLARDIMGVVAVIMLFAPLETTCIVGILRGAGDTRFAFAVDAGCTWGIGVTMGYLAGFVWKLPILWVYVCLRSDVFVRIALCLCRVLKGDYIKNVTRDI